MIMTTPANRLSPPHLSNLCQHGCQEKAAGESVSAFGTKRILVAMLLYARFDPYPLNL
jgi:hypothetical protein